MMTDNDNQNEQPDESRSLVRRFGLPVLAVAGAVTAGSFFAPVGLASAQDEDTDSTAEDDASDSDTGDSDTDTDDSDSDEAEKSDRRGNKRSGARGMRGLASMGDAVTDTLGVTSEDLRAAMADGKSLADVAEDQGVAVSDLTAAITTEIEEKLEEAVTEGKIDEDRAADMSDQLAERVDQMVNATVDDMKERMGARKAHRGEGRSSAHGEELAEFLGLSLEELQASRAEGQTLAELAEAQGVSEDDLVTFIMDGVQERMDEAVADGRIEADDAAERLADAEERVAEKVNAEPGERSDRRSGKGRFGHSHNNDGNGEGTGEGVQDTSA